eukprot:4822424-Alexandrium_andersonii.AAC.1
MLHSAAGLQSSGGEVASRAKDMPQSRWPVSVREGSRQTAGCRSSTSAASSLGAVSYTHLRAHETSAHL